MTARNPIIVVFVVIQLTGIICSWLCWKVPSGIGVPMWAVGFVILMPGNLLGSWITQSLFWQTGLSLPSMGAISTVLALGINAAVWFAVVRAVAAVLARSPTAKH